MTSEFVVAADLPRKAVLHNIGSHAGTGARPDLPHDRSTDFEIGASQRRGRREQA